MTDRKGFALWLTGLSGAGKSTLAQTLAPHLRQRGVPVEVLDGDEVRTNLSKGLGFSKQDRDTNIRRIGYVSRLLSRNGVGVITAAIAPYREVRNEVRNSVEQDGTAFVEVFVECPLEVLIERDVKGLYRRALAGAIESFTGVSDPYEEPLSPEVIIHSARESVDQSVARVLGELERRQLLPHVTRSLADSKHL